MVSYDYPERAEASALFSQLKQQAKPALIRNAINSVGLSHLSSSQWIDFVESHCNSTRLNVLRGPVANRGRVAYKANDSALNFTRTTLATERFFSLLRELEGQAEQPVLSLQSTKVEDYFMSLAPQVLCSEWGDVLPRLWVGGKTRVPAHVDDAHNFAINLCGRRRFTLFPPDQVANLYIGSVEVTPSGAPTSLVDWDNIDSERFPNAINAWANRIEIDLEPGDGIYIPPLWWHQVDATSPVNILLNYWQGGSIEEGSILTPFTLMYLSRLILEHRTASERKAWEDLYQHFVFSDPQQASHHVHHRLRGILATETSEEAQKCAESIIKSIAKKL